MGPHSRFQVCTFDETAFDGGGKFKLKTAIMSAKDINAESFYCSAHNVAMLSQPSQGETPICRRFDCSCSLSTDGCMLVVGEPCPTEVAEERCESSELMGFLQNVPIAMHWLSADGMILWANQKELEFLGYSAKEYIGQHASKFCPDDEDSSLFFSGLLCESNPVRDLHLRFRKKDGSIAEVLFDSDIKYNVKDDGTEHVAHIHCVIRDDTQRKVSEARTQLLLEETKKSLELLDNFMSRVVHHLKEPLHVLLMGSGFVADKLQEAQVLNSAMQATFVAGSNGDKGNAGDDTPSNGKDDNNANDVKCNDASASACAEQAFVLTECSEVVSQAEKSVSRTLLLLDDISDLVRTDAYGTQAALPLQLVEQVDLAAVCRAAIDAMEPCHPGVICEIAIHEREITGGRAGVNTSDGSQGAALMIKTDPILLKRALVHLLNNAAAATTRGSVTLRLSVDETIGQPLLSIEDSGPGLSSAAFDTAMAGSVSGSSTRKSGTCKYNNSDQNKRKSRSNAEFGITSINNSPSNPVFNRYHHELIPESTSTLDEASLQALRSRLLVGLRCRTSQKLGLGLSLSYQLVQALGGELQYETRFASRSFDDGSMDDSCASGLKRNGTRFWFSLPAVSSIAQNVPEEPNLNTEASAEINIKTITAVLAPLAAASMLTTALTSQLKDGPALSDKRKEPCIGVHANLGVLYLGSEPPQKKRSKFLGTSKMTPDISFSSGADETAHKLNVLVVEDSAVCAKLICMQLKKLKCTYTHAENGQKALDVLQCAVTGTFDLVLCDLRMPIMDGFEACNIIKANYQDLPVVALSGESGLDIKALVRINGFDDFVPKPAKREQIEFVVEKYTAAGSK